MMQHAHGTVAAIMVVTVFLLIYNELSFWTSGNGQERLYKQAIEMAILMFSSPYAA
jgi:hypothetical protein